MEVEIAKEIGFCFGVRKAIEALDKVINESDGKIYVTGELVHNREALKKYEAEGVRFTTDVNEYSDTVVIRAHGISDEERERIKSNSNIKKIVDATCPYVLRVHHLTKKMAEEGYHIIIIGEKDHPETRGYYLNVKDKCTVIEPSVDIKEMKLPRVKRVAIFAQTTMDYEKFKEIVKEMVTEFDEARVFMTICPPVVNRQKSVIQLSKECDLIIVLGGYNSSNTKKLRDLCAKYTESLHIERISELDTNILKGKKKVGIAAGTSTPDWIIQEAYEFLKSYVPS